MLSKITLFRKNLMNCLSLQKIWFIILFFGLLTFSKAAEPDDAPVLPDDFKNYVETESDALIVNEPLTRGMDKNQLHFYTFRGEAEKCLRLAVEQKGTNVIVTLISPSKQKLAFVERSNTLLGPENMTFVLPESGIYTVEIKSNDWVEVKNGYTIELKPFTVPTADDLKRIEAERLVSEGDLLSFDSESVKRKESIIKFKRAIDLWDDLGEEYERDVAYYGLGWAYLNEGDYENAAAIFGKGAENFRLSGERFMLAHCLRANAFTNSRMGEYVNAVIYSQESVSIFRTFEMSRYIGAGLQALGYAQYFLEDYSNALGNFNEALEHRRKSKDANGEILTLTALAKTHSRMKNYLSALEFIQNARGKAGNSKLDTQTEILIEEGWILLDLRRLVEAEKSFAAALDNYRAINSVSGQATAYFGLGLIKQQRKELKPALEEVEKSLELIENLRGKLTDNNFRLSFSAANQFYYEIHINLLMELHRAYPNKGYDARAFAASERARARVLLELMNESGFSSRQNVPLDLKDKLRVLRTRYIANLKEWKRLSRINDKAALKILNVEIQKTILEKRQIEAHVKNNFSNKNELRGFFPVSAENIQALLDDETILLEFGLYRNNYGDENSYLWVVEKNKIKGFTLAPRSVIEEKINRAYRLLTVRNELSKNPSGRERQAETEYRQVSAELSKILLEPLIKENLLGGKKKLLIVANGILQSLPFAALPNPSAADEYLISSFEIVNLPSASILAALRERQNRRGAREKTAMVLADPIFSRHDERFAAANLNSQSDPGETRPVLRLTDYFTENDLPRLFSTRFEAEQISSYLPDDQKRIAIDFNATVESVTKTDLSNFRILHFATHALIDDEMPELSGIALSMFDRKRQPLEGFLLSGDISDLKLNADLVVLSGCRTGLGKPVRGEGFVGLTQSFMYAGASRLLTSLWSVEDRATAQLMANFYKYHLDKKMTVPAALKEAQKEMSRHPRWKNPYFWAAFTLQGEFK